MAYAPTDFASRENAFTQSPTFTQTSAQNSMPSARRIKRGLFRRVLDALMASRQQQADREIARYLHLHAGKLTDEAEREIERRFLTPPSGKY